MIMWNLEIWSGSFYKVKHTPILWLRNSPCRHLSRRSENTYPLKELFKNVHRSFIHDSQKPLRNKGLNSPSAGSIAGRQPSAVSPFLELEEGDVEFSWLKHTALPKAPPSSWRGSPRLAQSTRGWAKCDPTWDHVERSYSSRAPLGRQEPHMHPWRPLLGALLGIHWSWCGDCFIASCLPLLSFTSLPSLPKL